MRLLALRGRNLASLGGDFALDFTAAPLSHARLFAITGPTGAGKSTLLDALCLALFNRVPRLALDASQKGKADDTRLNSGDVRNLLRRGTGSGYAEVDFTARDGAALRARWEVWRARQRSEGRWQAQAITLTTLDGQPLTGGSRGETLDTIRDRLGLDFDQFRRSVLLAQGDFAAFLKASPDERAGLLELVTGTDIYTKVSVLAHNRSRQEEAALRVLAARRESFVLLTAEARASAEAVRAEHGAAVLRAEARLEAAQRRVKWTRDDARLAADIAQAEIAAQTAGAAFDAAAPRREALALAQRVAPLRPVVQEADRTRRAAEEAVTAENRAMAARDEAGHAVTRDTQALAETEAALARTAEEAAAQEPVLAQAAALDLRLETLAADHVAAEAVVRQARDRAGRCGKDAAAAGALVARLDQEVAVLDREFTAESALAAVAAQWPRWQAVLERLSKTRSAAAAAGKVLAGLCQDRAATMTEITALAAGYARAEQAVDSAQERLRQARAIAAALPAPAALVARRDEAEAALAATRQRHALAQQAAALISAEAACGADTEIHRAQAREAAAAAASAALALASVRAALAEAESSLERLRLARRADVAALRATLADGTPCPVCGAESHPWGVPAAPPVLDALTREQQQRVEDLRQQRDQQFTTQEAARAKADAADKALARLAALAQTHAVQRQDLATALHRGEAGAGEDAFAALFAPETAPGLADAVARGEQVLAELRVQEADTQAAQQALMAATEAVGAARETLAGLGRQRAALNEKAARLEQQVASLSEEQTRLAAEQAGCLDELHPPFAALPDWPAGLERAPAAWTAQLAARIGAWNVRLEKQAQTRAALDMARTRHGESQHAVAAAGEAVAATAAALATAAARLIQAQQDRQGMLAGQTVAAVRTRLALRRDQATRARDQALARVRASETARAAAVQRAESAVAARAQNQQAAQDARQALHAALAGQEPPLDEAILCHILAQDAGAVAAEEKALAALAAAVDRAAVTLEERRLQRQRHQDGAPAPDASGPLFTPDQDAEAAAAAVDAARKALHEADWTLRRDDEARAALAATQEPWQRQQAITDQWKAMNEVIGSHDGRTFRKFAQGLTLEQLLGHTNRELGSLNPRYRLERVPGTDMDLQVADLDMGSETRSAYSLSGGETFLVSLALALGLSALSGGPQAGTLFIDEGFGALDPQSLDLALACLETLQASGRCIGVVSHLPAVIERIPVHIRVQPTGGGRSTVSVGSGATI